MKICKTILAASITAALYTNPAVFAAEAAAPGAASAADAQNTPGDKTEQLETIVVTGIRDSLKRSLDDKRVSDTHVEVITAEDIGKMPDKNVADSLSRVAGVTTSSASANEGGFDENDRVSMRGTSPSLTQTLINGHNVASGDWFVLNQSGTVGRSVTYTLLPSEIVNKIVVHKTAQASDVEGGVVGSVDIQTRRPLEFKNALTGMATVGAVYADLPDKTDPQFSGLVNWKNADNTFGVMLQAFSEKRHLRRDGQELLTYEQIAPGSKIAKSNPDLAGVWYPGYIGSALFEQTRKRQGGLVDVEWAPNDRLKVDLSAFSSKMDASNYNRNYILWNTHFINQGTGQAPDPGYVVRNGTLVSANFTANPNTQYGIYDQISRPDASSRSRFVNLDADFRVSDALSLHGKAGDSRGNGRTPTQNVAEWDTGIGTGAGYHLNGTGTAAQWNLGSENYAAGPKNLDWIFGVQNVNVKDEEKWGQLDGTYTLGQGVLSSIQAGVRYENHTRKLHGSIAQGPGCAGGPLDWSQQYACKDPSQSPFNPGNYPSAFTLYPSDFGNGLGNGFPTGIWQLSPGQLAAFDKNTFRDPTLRAYWQNDYGLDEKNKAYFVQGNFDGDHWSGNLGVRVVNTDENVLVNVGVDSTTPGAITTSLFGPYLPTHVDHSYTDVLPSGNLKFNLTDDMVLRFAAAKTMTRADYSALAGSVSLLPPSAPGSIGTGSGGNPDLKPIRATNYDVSYEWYFAQRSLFSASVYALDLGNYIGFGHITKTFKTFNKDYPQGFDVDYILTVPVNSSGNVKGVELAYEQPIGENFGFAVNYTYADGHEQGGGPLVGLSKTTWNANAYYEDEHINARLGYTYRSSFYSGLDRSTAFSQKGVGTLSGSLGYKLDDHWSFSLDALNLNKPRLEYYALNQDQPRSMYNNGRQYYLSAHFKF